MINIFNKLRNAPKGLELYSPLCGKVEFLSVDYRIIHVKKCDGVVLSFDEYGRYFDSGECLLFPSKRVQHWGNFTLEEPKKKYDFKPFDKVVVRDDDTDIWTIDFFSYKEENIDEAPYVTINGWYNYCLPYNEETAKLIGTSNDYEF